MCDLLIRLLISLGAGFVSALALTSCCGLRGREKALFSKETNAITDAIGIVIVSPLLETILLILMLKALEKIKITTGVLQACIVGVFFVVMHSYILNGYSIAVFPLFFLWSITFLAYRKFGRGVGEVFALHASHNLLVMLALLWIE